MSRADLMQMERNLHLLGYDAKIYQGSKKYGFGPSWAVVVVGELEMNASVAGEILGACREVNPAAKVGLAYVMRSGRNPRVTKQAVLKFGAEHD